MIRQEADHPTLEGSASARRRRAVCEVEVHRLAQPPLRANAEAVADEQHPDHQLGIDRWTPGVAVEGLEVPPHVPEVDEPTDRTHQVVRRNVGLEREPIEKRCLLDYARPHHLLRLPV